MMNNETNAKIDFLAVGDTVIDAFIRLNNAEETMDINHHQRKICMNFADKVPYEFVEILPAVGNSANAAVSAARLGLSSAILTNVGEDQYGQDCIDSFKRDYVRTDFVKINEGKKTNYHYVLWFHNDRTILIKHEEYDYELPEISSPSWIYLSSLGEHTLSFHQKFGEYIKAHPEVKLVFQPGTYQMSFGTEALKDIYENTEIFFCNVEEAQRILKSEETDVKRLMKMIADLGPKIVVITDGPNGAYTYDTSSGAMYFMKPYPDPKEPYERTGAGDSFSSTFTSAIAIGKSIPDAMKWGSINSMSVVQQVGAQKGLLTRDALEKFLNDAPADFEVQEIK
jgi:ribokinase